MCRARSQSRWRSPLILSTAATRRRSEATGWCRASTRTHSRSIWTSQRSTCRFCRFDLVGQLDPAVAQGVDALVQRLLDDRRQLQHLGPEALHVADEAAAHRDPPVVPVRVPGLPFLPHRVDPRPLAPSRSAGRLRPVASRPAISPLDRGLPRRRDRLRQLIQDPAYEIGRRKTTPNPQIHENFTMIGEVANIP